MREARTATLPMPHGIGQPLYAAVWMSLAILSFSAMAVGGRELIGQLDTFSIMFYRSLIGFAVVTSILVATGRFAVIRTRRPGTHLGRNLAHFSGQSLWFYAVGQTTLAQVFALEFTAPIWVALLAPVFLSERFTGWRIATTAAGFAGVLVVVRPGVLAVDTGEVAALAAAICLSANIMMTKSLSRTEPTLCIMFWMTAIQLVLGAIMVGGQPMLLDFSHLPWVLVVGVSGLLAQVGLARAFRHADASVAAPMDFLRLPLIAVVGMLAYAEPLDPYVFLGGAIVFLANYVNVWRSRQKAG
ncbi:drug/metabolite transporter (DMT)-like permease [Breoghania corrubedonensis]|uniref:Drug/metabolite transporter (DMT)-like permease n=1 Tax=Breoghania corrubedonensis TaxID=665038 RepID=A0A2T5UW34_9HYPH|nr:DMT family transporter [Breoghania corrubedonensis]PTW55716.1 drug/metabolite transporter (DMT)-like permease [Breoghania corrubedonensis]